jgi:hypothetical protein
VHCKSDKGIMFTNKKISENINQWNIEYDPYGFSTDENWLKKAEKTEDILQICHINGDGPVIDVGFYRVSFKIYVIYGTDWENPKELFESKDIKKLSEKIYDLIDKYSKG